MSRYLLVTFLFCALCVAYLGKLLSVQLGGRVEEEETTRTRTVTIQATRGEIYDRNGVKLVANTYSYDLIFTYQAVRRLSVFRRNDLFLLLFGVLESYGESGKHTEAYFPLEGAYPHYRYSDAAADPDSAVGARLRRVLSEQGLKEGITAEALAKYYVNTYQLLAKNSRGERLFSDDEVDRLFRLYYDMDSLRFSYYGEYVFAAGVGLPLMTGVREMSGTDAATFRVTAERTYLYPGVASHILGTVGPIYSEEWDYYDAQGYHMNAIVGKSGCELAFESYLRGVDGEMKIIEDEDGNVIRVETVSEPIAGKDVFLTLDLELQIAAEKGLAETVAYVSEREGTSSAFVCDAGAAVVMDPDTFEVLAIASYPSYDLTTYNSVYADLQANPANPLLNRALQGAYAPGSTFKPGVAVAGLEEGVITPQTTFYCDITHAGKYTYPESLNDHPSCSTWDLHTTSWLTVHQAIADSCNSFFYELGRQLGIDKMESWMSAFGFGQKTGIELGETAGTLAGEGFSHAPYQTGQVIRAAIGQSDTQATPLQLCSYMATLYNGGTRLSAHLLDHVTAFGSGEVVWDDSTLIGEPLATVPISPSTRKTVLDGMRDMISGTAFTRARLPGVGLDSVCGKTGTAEVVRSYTDAAGETVTETVTNALFLCGAEYKGKNLVASFVVENAGHGYYNAIAARSVLSAWKKLIDEKTEDPT